jgi:hypothetical protein
MEEKNKFFSTKFLTLLTPAEIHPALKFKDAPRLKTNSVSFCEYAVGRLYLTA